jgi:hypothetical protein
MAAGRAGCDAALVRRRGADAEGGAGGGRGCCGVPGEAGVGVDVSWSAAGDRSTSGARLSGRPEAESRAAVAAARPSLTLAGRGAGSGMAGAKRRRCSAGPRSWLGLSARSGMAFLSGRNCDVSIGQRGGCASECYGNSALQPPPPHTPRSRSPPSGTRPPAVRRPQRQAPAAMGSPSIPTADRVETSPSAGRKRSEAERTRLTSARRADRPQSEIRGFGGGPAIPTSAMILWRPGSCEALAVASRRDDGRPDPGQETCEKMSSSAA